MYQSIYQMIDGSYIGKPLFEILMIKDIFAPNASIAVEKVIVERALKILHRGFITDSTKINQTLIHDLQRALNLAIYRVPDEMLKDIEIAIRKLKLGLPELKLHPRSTAKSGFLYLIKNNDDNYKIGLSVQPKKRIHALGVKLPFPIYVEHLIKTNDMYQAEKILHEKFRTKRLAGEWFALTTGDVSYIKKLQNIICFENPYEYPEAKLIRQNKGINPRFGVSI